MSSNGSSTRELFRRIITLYVALVFDPAYRYIGQYYSLLPIQNSPRPVGDQIYNKASLRTCGFLVRMWWPTTDNRKERRHSRVRGTYARYYGPRPPARAPSQSPPAAGRGVSLVSSKRQKSKTLCNSCDNLAFILVISVVLI